MKMQRKSMTIPWWHWIPVMGFALSLAGLWCTISNFRGYLITGTWHVSLGWQAISALFWSVSAGHWFSNTCFLLFLGIVLATSNLGWLNQFLIFMVAGSLANLIFGLLLTSFGIHSLVMGASAGIMGWVGANLVNLWTMRPVKWRVKLGWTLFLGLGLWLGSPMAMTSSGGLHVLGLLSGMVVMLGINHYQLKRM